PTRDPRRDRGGGDAPVRGTSRGQSRGRRGVARRGVVAWLVATALRHRVVVFIAAVALVVVGVQAARESPLDVFPEFAPPVVEIQTEAAGLAAEDVEALVTTPLERALGGLPDLTLLRSSSAPGLAVITAVFSYGTDPYRARQLVIERLALVATALP